MHMMELHDQTKIYREKNVILKNKKLFMNKNSGIFPNELNELPPIKEIDHIINLLIDVIAVSRASKSFFLAQNDEL
jgi:hypothetical protein